MRPERSGWSLLSVFGSRVCLSHILPAVCLISWPGPGQPAPCLCLVLHQMNSGHKLYHLCWARVTSLIPSLSSGFMFCCGTIRSFLFVCDLNWIGHLSLNLLEERTAIEFSVTYASPDPQCVYCRSHRMLLEMFQICFRNINTFYSRGINGHEITTGKVIE